MSLNLTIIAGSMRPGRTGITVARWMEAQAQAQGAFDLAFADLVEIGLPLLDEAQHPAFRAYEKDHTKRWSEIVDRSDAFVFVTPEYDYFPPASVVNAVQSVFLEWGRKVAGVASYGGQSGGLRSTDSLRLLLSNVGMMPLPQSVSFPYVHRGIGEDGSFAPGAEAEEAARKMLDELHLWAGALKPLRG